MVNLKGTKTEENLKTAFAGEKKKATIRLLIFLLRPPAMKKNMLNFGSKLCMMVCQTLLKI